ncbi:MAG: bifunctional DNA-formamidopyrimidine glycosylase/DNA-(apurinic or apyrimidinic site) lyase [Gammaproteobacteria bacterium]|nr:bifunctional DNA-formamidopyrimidine glycosylase/DNA-(apurinic or apyrimidinic site) lyase [Gammaproteobacteria bacterium]
MPELPEVETSRRGIEPHILNKTISDVIIRQHQLRWPIPKSLPNKILTLKLKRVTRRGKYLLLGFVDNNTVIIHLGMSGSLKICTPSTPAGKHDHVDFIFNHKIVLRLTDPRKFGCVLWTNQTIEQHKLLSKLGPEPLTDDFNANYLYAQSRKRNCSVKAFIMNSHIVVGVGNIYASESLFLSGINPVRKAGSLSILRCEKLVAAIKQILIAAIEHGGTTLRDFTRENGQPGYFAQQLHVYGRAHEACPNCGKAIKQISQLNRSTFYCTACQK